MITCYRITDGQYTGVDVQESCPDGWTTVAPPTDELPHGRAYLWDGDGWVEGMDGIMAAKRIDSLWKKANAFAKSGLDQNDIASLTPGLSLPIPAGHRAQILQWLLWGSQVWQAYYTAKAAIEAGDLDATMAGLPEPIDRRRVIEIQTSIAQTAANELSKAQG